MRKGQLVTTDTSDQLLRRRATPSPDKGSAVATGNYLRLLRDETACMCTSSDASPGHEKTQRRKSSWSYPHSSRHVSTGRLAGDLLSVCGPDDVSNDKQSKLLDKTSCWPVIPTKLPEGLGHLVYSDPLSIPYCGNTCSLSSTDCFSHHSAIYPIATGDYAAAGTTDLLVRDSTKPLGRPKRLLSENGQ